MFAVELYAKIRRAVMVDGSEPPGGGSTVWRSPELDLEDAEVFNSARLPAA